MNKTIIMVQHTESEHHLNGMIGACYDWEFTENGKKQANKIGQWLSSVWNIEEFHMYVSDRKRALQTAKEINEYLHGLYGASPAPVDEEIRRKIIGDEEVITHRPADDLAPQFEAMKEKYKGLCKSDEDVLSCALFENVAVKFLENRNKVENDEIVEINLFVG